MGGASVAFVTRALTPRLSWDTGRTLIFTTHHLDEAEALSDRVAILQHGRLRCWAPPSCLTEAYGQGLSLTLTKQVRNERLRDLPVGAQGTFHMWDSEGPNEHFS